MDGRFALIVESLEPKFQELLMCKPFSGGLLPTPMPSCGVYLFTENGKHLYVGRSNKLKNRYSGHCRLGATEKTAAFAFLLARDTTGFLKASYKKNDLSRAGLMLNQTFKEAFIKAKRRIRAMEYRFVEERDQNCQALLEMYCAIVLDTPHNDFGNH